MSWNVTERRVNSVTILELDGRLTMGAGSEALNQKLKSLIAEGHRALLLNCSQVSAIDSQGIQALVLGVRLAKNNGGQLKLLKPSSRLRESLKVTRLLPLFESFDDEEKALRSFTEAASAG